MKQRIITGAIMAVIVGAVFALRGLTDFIGDAGIYIFDAFLGIMLVSAAGEVSKVFNRSRRYNFMTFATLFPLFLYLALLLSIYFNFGILTYFLIVGSLFFVMVFLAFILPLFMKKTNRTQIEESNFTGTESQFCLKKSLMTTFVVFYPTMFLNFLFVLNHINQFEISVLPINSEAINLGFMVLALLFLVNVMTDTFAYFVGVTFKGPKIWPLISPNKTYSGCIGGLLGSMLISVVLYYVFTAYPMVYNVFVDSQITVFTFLLYGFFASVISQLGGLFASWLKRKAKTKDYSTIFPGHGGFMDRLDGVTFTAVFTFVFIMVMFL